MKQLLGAIKEKQRDESNQALKHDDLRVSV